MADAPIKGLTIRFGADITEFSSRMSSLNRIIGSTATKLRQMTNALKGDPQNVVALTAKFKLLDNQAQNVAMRIGSLRLGLKEMDRQGVGKLAAEIKNSAQNVLRWDDSVKRVNKELNRSYNTLKALASEAGMTEKEIKKAFDKGDIEGFIQRIEKGEKYTEEIGMQARALVPHIQRLKQVHEEVNHEREKAQQIHDYKTMQTDMAAAQAEARQLAREIVEVNRAIANTGEKAQSLERLGSEFEELRMDGQRLDEELKDINNTLRKTNFKNAEAGERAVEAIAERLKNAREQLTNLNEQLSMRQSQTGVKRVTESMSQLTAKVREAEERAVQMQESLLRVRSTIQEMQRAYDSLNDKIKRGESLTEEEKREMKELAQAIEAAQREEQKLADRAKVADKQLRLAEARQAQKKLQMDISKTTSRMIALTAKTKAFGMAALNSMRDFATGLGATAAPAVMMLGMHVVNAGDQIDTAFRDMKKTVNGTEEQFQKLRKSAVEFSRTHPVSADTILEIQSIGGQLGIAVDELEQFSHVVSNLDIATNMDSEEIALNLGKLRNIFSELGWDTEKFGDSLVRLGNNTPALESDIMNITTRFAGMSAILGILPDEALAIATAATSTGQKADAAGGSLQRTLGRLEGAVAGVSEGMKNLDDMTEEDIEAFEEAKGKLGEYAEIAGMSAEEFAELWSNHKKVSASVTGLGTDMTGTTAAFTKFINGLKEIKDNGGSVDFTLQKLGITGVRDRQLLEGLTNTTGVLSDSLKMSANAWKGAADEWGNGGDAAYEASKKAEGFSGKLAMLKNTAQTMGDAFAGKLVPVLDKLLGILNSIAPVIDNMSEETATFIAAIGAATVVMAPVIRMFSQSKITAQAFANALRESGIAAKGMRVAAAEAQAGMQVIGTSAQTAGGKLGTLTTKFAGMSAGMKAAAAGAASLAIVGIALLISKIVEYIKEQEKFKKATSGMKDLFYETSDAAKKSASTYSSVSVYKSVAEDVKKLIDDHAQLYDTMKESKEETSTSIGMLEHYGQVLKDNTGISKHSKAGAERLAQAVEYLNNAYGLGLEVVEKNGKLYAKNGDEILKEASAIDALIEAKKREIEIRAIEETLVELNKQKIQDAITLAEAEKQLAIAQEEYNEALKRGDPYLESYSVALDKAKRNYNDAKAAADGTQESINALEAQLTRATEATDEHGNHVKELADKYPVLASELDQISDKAFGEFVDAVEESGHSVDELEQLSASDIAAMVSSWKNGTDSWKHDMEVASDRMRQEARKTDEEVAKEFEKMKSDTIAEISELTGVSEEELYEMAAHADLSSEMAMEKWVQNIRDRKLDSKNAAGENVKAARQELENAQGYARTAGENFSLGFAIGIDKYLGAAATNAAKLGVSAVNSLKNATREASPSKLTRQAGIYFGEGFQLGMEDEEDAIRRQAAMLGNIAAGALASSNSASAASLSGRAMTAMGYRGSTTNNNDNSTANTYITLNVDAHDLNDIRTIDDLVAMARRAQAQYAS